MPAAPLQGLSHATLLQLWEGASCVPKEGHSWPLSPQRCWCDLGYRLAEDGLSCMDINECTEQGKGACSQMCLNAPGSYSCGCFPGYLLEPNFHDCKLTGKPWDSQGALRVPGILRYSRSRRVLVSHAHCPRRTL